jgi:uncharacterized cupredoxin-like copper-binding protein
MINGISAIVSAAVLAGAALSAHDDASKSAKAAPPVVEIRAKDFGFTGPKTVKSGPTTFRLVNDGKELHHVSIIKLAKGKTMKDFGEAMKKQGPPPGWMVDVGGPNAAGPNQTVEATLSLEPGEYALVCFINSPGDPTPHMAKGMVGSLTVLPAASGATMPATDITVTLDDYSFTFSKPFTAGKHVVNVVNKASQSHEVVFVKLAPGKTMADMVKYAEKDLMKGPPPGQVISGMAGMAKGRLASFPVDLTPGTYGMICFVPDHKDGKPHVAHGMVKQFEVK